MEFDGFPATAPAFFEALAADNTREFWAANSATYDRDVRKPFTALFAELADEFGETTLFRQHRDTRFSKDKSPYKTYAAGFNAESPGIGRYVELSGRGLLVGGGFHARVPRQTAAFRAAVDADGPGAELQRITEDLEQAGFTIEGDQVKTAPRGYPRDHPRIDLLRRKQLTAAHALGTPDWLATSRTADEVREAWRLVTPLVDWVTEHVGPA